MKVIILAAGYGTRLYPLTADIPKPLLPIAGIPIIERILSLLKGIKQIDDIFIVTNHKFVNVFTEWLATYRTKTSNRYKIKIIDDGTTAEADRLGPIGDIVHVYRSQAVEDDLLIIAGDNLFHLDFSLMLTTYEEKHNSILAVYDLKEKNRVKNRFGVVLTDDTKRVISFEEKPENPQSSVAATAIYLLRNCDIKIIEAFYEKNMNRELNSGDMIKVLLDDNVPIYCIHLSEWIDIGSPDDLKLAQKYYS
jgi:glucose-1-phosphate thymidylyltransferase